MWIVDLLVVAAGVLLALLTQQWVETRRQRALERQYLASLREDLETDLLTIAGQKQRLEVYTAAVQYVLDVVEGRRSGIDDPEAFSRAATTCFYVEFFEPTATTFEELKTTGNLRVVGQREIIRAILKYHQRVASSYRTRPYLMDRLWNGLWLELKNHLDRRIFPEAMAAVYASTTPRLAAPHGEPEGFSRVSVAPVESPFGIDRIRGNEALLNRLLDAMEVHASLRGELEVYEGLCRETLESFSDP